MTPRFDDWPERLHDYLLERENMPVNWGVHDCCTFACGAIFEQCGVDPMETARGRYKKARGAIGWLRRNGGDLPTAAVKLGIAAGLPEISPLMAGRGCIVLAPVPIVGGELSPALGIVGLDSRRALFVTDETTGYFEIPVVDCSMAWGFG